MPILSNAIALTLDTPFILPSVLFKLHPGIADRFQRALYTLS